MLLKISNWFIIYGYVLGNYCVFVLIVQELYEFHIHSNNEHSLHHFVEE